MVEFDEPSLARRFVGADADWTTRAVGNAAFVCPVTECSRPFNVYSNLVRHMKEGTDLLQLSLMCQS